MQISNIKYLYTPNSERVMTKFHYELTWSNGDKSTFRIEDAESNRHYEDILKWVADGNTITDDGGA
tara:strand:+ start:862 stop:1059 length:198 start_codon:yes stop_codon:yes gene_type:complete